MLTASRARGTCRVIYRIDDKARVGDRGRRSPLPRRLSNMIGRIAQALPNNH
jgi:hypothetical protein